MIHDTDERWERLENEAERLTEQNRTELAERATKERELAIEAMTTLVESMNARSIAEILWEEREYELQDVDSFAPGYVERTDLASLFAEAAKQYASDNAERVSAEELDIAEHACAADAENDRSKEEAP